MSGSIFIGAFKPVFLFLSFNILFSKNCFKTFGVLNFQIFNYSYMVSDEDVLIVINIYTAEANWNKNEIKSNVKQV